MRVVSYSTLAVLARVNRMTVTRAHSGKHCHEYSRKQIDKAYRLAIAMLVMQRRKFNKH